MHDTSRLTTYISIEQFVSGTGEIINCNHRYRPYKYK